jgi:fused signal recognition particle receptor
VTLYLLSAAAVAAVAVAWILLRHHSSSPPPIRRDSPTVETPAPTRPRLGTRLGGLLVRPVDAAFWESLADGLIAADVGVAAATVIVDRVRDTAPGSPELVRAALRQALVDEFAAKDRSMAAVGSPAIVVVVGVNGSGKTTTVAKLAAEHMAAGRSVLVGAVDTFRAAAAEQMTLWGDRIGFDVVQGSEGADPAAVAFDALSAARARGVDVLVVDTAGRLHSKQNLMDELAKVIRVLSRESGSIDEILLVIDGTTGQNAVAQARAFTEAVGVTGVAVTKLDGSAKGGVALAVERDLGIPLKLIGVGEGVGDLLHFDPAAFVDELLEGQ